MHSKNHSSNEYDDSHDEVGFQGITSMNETLIGQNIAQSVPWPDEWRTLVDDMRAAPFKVFWELFSGSAEATKGFKKAGWCVGKPVDVADNPAFNLLSPGFIALVIALIWEGMIAVLWLGPPCSSFSMAVNRFWSHAMRDKCSPGGFNWLKGIKLEKVLLGNALATIACRLFNIAVMAGSRVVLKQPTTSLMWLFQAFVDLHSGVKGWFGNRDVCLDGAPWRKPTSFYSNEKAIITTSGTCNCTVKHIALVGKCEETGENWTKIAGPYWPGTVRSVEKPFHEFAYQSKSVKNSSPKRVLV